MLSNLIKTKNNYFRIFTLPLICFILQEKYIREDIDLNADSSDEKHHPPSIHVNPIQTKKESSTHKPTTASHLKTSLPPVNRHSGSQYGNNSSANSRNKSNSAGKNSFVV